MENSGDVWLWMDAPRTSAGVDWPAGLAEGIRRFGGKERWAGQAPEVVKACPAAVADGLTPAAAALGLRVVADRLVPAGSFWLGIDKAER